MVKPDAPFPPIVAQATPAGEVWKLILSAKPSAEIRLYETIPPEANHGVTVEKYSSRFGANFERHIDAHGVVTWWRNTRVDAPEPRRKF